MKSRRTFLSTLLICCFAVLAWSIAPEAIALGGRLPTIGQPAPDFTLPTNTGNGSVSLSDWRGKWVVLYFYPKDFTAGCTLEARRFQQDLPRYLDKDTQIIGVSADSVDSHAEFCDSEGLKFPLLADTTGAVSKAYGSWMGFVSIRHSFIIDEVNAAPGGNLRENVDPKGILRETFVKVNPAIHSTEVLARINELQTATSS